MDKAPLKSEADESAALLAELERNNEIKEIAGWDTGFASLTRTLNGISSGLYFLAGPPGSGKSAFAKQFIDQIARLNSLPAVFFTCAEKKSDLRIRTLARLSGLETREIRRGAGYLLHAYGVSKHASPDPNEIAPGWEKLKLVAEQARSWLDLVYISECDARATLSAIEQRIGEARALKKSARLIAAIDDGQLLGNAGLSLDARLPLVAEKLAELALRLDLPLLATWPDFHPGETPQLWTEKVAGAKAVMVMREDPGRKPAREPDRALALHVVKNSAGETAVLRFDFTPPLSRFVEASNEGAINSSRS